MKIYAGRKRSEFPPIPVKPVMSNDPIDNCPSFWLFAEKNDTTPIHLYVLKSRNQAKQFVMSLLSNHDFPLVSATTTKLEEYRMNKDLYIEDMEYARQRMDDYDSFIDSSDGECLYILNDSGWHTYEYGDFEEALDAYRNANNIKCLIFNSSYGYVVFNAIMVWDNDDGKYDDFGTWYAESDDSVNGRLYRKFNEYEWINVYGTDIMMPPWATKKSDFMK